MAYQVAPHLTTLEKVGDETIAPAGSLLPSFQSVTYDPYGNANLGQGGVNVTKSGIYLFSYNGVLTGAATTGAADIFPTSIGPTSFKGARGVNIPHSVDMEANLSWTMYLGVSEPDVIVLEIDNNTDANLTVSGGGVLTLVRLG